MTTEFGSASTTEASPLPKHDRRKFLGNTAKAGLAGILLAKTPPAFTKERELKLLTWSHFVPSSDEELKRQLEEYGKMAGIKVRMDRIAHLQLPAVYAGEVQGKKGHDITVASNAIPNLYSKSLVNLDDLYEKVGGMGGGWTTDTFGLGQDGSHKALPWFFISFPIALRTDLISGIGENLPDTWEDVHRIGTKLKKQGHPLGIQLAHSADSNWILRGILWSWGAKLVEADSKTVAINSKEAVEAYKFVKALYNDAMDKEVLAWDDRNNNVCLTSGKCSMILNPISAYNSAVTGKVMIQGTNRPIHQVINHIIPPKGPAGRHMAASHAGIGVWNFSKNIEPAKEFLEFHFQRENQLKFLEASRGYNQPMLRSFALHPIYASNPKFYFAAYIGWYTHAIGYPGIPTAASQTVYDQFIIPDTAAECATGKLSPEDAVKKAQTQLKRIYRRFRTA